MRHAQSLLTSLLRTPLLLVLFAIPALSQTPNATVSGRIVDPTGALVVGAHVSVISDATNLEYSRDTNEAGIYLIPFVPPGKYHVQVSKAGFKNMIEPNILLQVQDALTINFALELGASSQSVTVEGGVSLVDVDSASVSTVIDRKFVENLPLNGRSFQALIALTPGVVLTSASSNEQGQFSVNGQRADANYFSVDGVSANIGVNGNFGSGLAQGAVGALPGLSALGGTNTLISIDAMQEFRVQTSSFAPEYGRTPGGQVSIVSRSGTNAFHGTLFDYFRNDVFDANDWFSAKNGLKKPKERQNDFGGVFGGPIIRNRTFFFFSYEGLRLRQPVTQETVVPDNDSRQQAPLAVQPFLAAYPVPNGASLGGGLAQFNASYSNPSSLDAYSLRMDHAVTSKLTLFGRYNYAPSTAVQRGPAVNNASVLSNVVSTSFSTQTFTLGLTDNIAQRSTNELRLNYSNVRAGTEYSQDSFGGAIPAPFSSLLPVNIPTGQLNFYITGVGKLSVGKNVTNEQRQFNVVDNVTLTSAGHQMKFGVDYRWLAPFSSPEFYVQLPLFVGMSGALSGVPLQTNVYSYLPSAVLSQNLSLFAQDTWEVSHRLHLTYGARWDVNPPIKGKNSASQLYTIVGLSDPATASLAPRGTPLYQTTYANVAPRVGIAFQMSQTQGWETVLRGGFGLFYDLGSGFLGYATAGYPFFAVKTVNNTPFPLTPAQAVPPPGSTPKNGMYVAEPGLQLPRTYEWNASLEQSLGPSQTLSMTYIGAVGRDLLRQDSLNNPNPTFGFVGITRNTASSDYHAFQLKFQRRLSQGLQILASYTLSHSIDVSSTDSGTYNTPSAVSDPGVDRGDSNFDVRHSMSSAMSYDLPSLVKNQVGRSILGGWSLDAFLLARSAEPVDVLGPLFGIDGTFFQSRPDVLPGVPLYLYGSQYPGGKALNKAAFVAASPGTQGNFGRNVLRGFGAWQADVALRRQFEVAERVRLQFRAEFFNIFNHPNFGSLRNSLSDPLFGQSTQMLAPSLGSGGAGGGFNPLYQVGGPRSIQFALRLAF